MERFRGMFAFALWDRNRQTFFMARDRMGVKPMYYAIPGRWHPDVRIRAEGADAASLALTEAWTLWRSKSTLLLAMWLSHVPSFQVPASLSPASPCAFVTASPSRSPKPYWDVRFTLDNKVSLADAQAEMVERLRESVRLRMVAEVPLGAFLSGGVDSVPWWRHGRPVFRARQYLFHPLTIRPSTNLRRLPRWWLTVTRPIIGLKPVQSDDFDLIDTLAALYDEPYADSSAIPTYRVCQLAPQTRRDRRSVG